jgi:hypothetical protein
MTDTPTADTDPIDELMRVLAATLAANELRLTTTRGGYVGGGQPHVRLDSDRGAVEAVARGMLARKVAEPSRAVEAEARAGLDVVIDAAGFMLDLVDEYYGTDHEFDLPEEAPFRHHRAVIEAALARQADHE